MLRIGTPPPAPTADQPPPDVAPPPDAPPDVVSDSTDQPKMLPMQKIPQESSGYLGAEYGPFQCSNCTFWQEPNSCSVVDGQIDPHGLCHNFTNRPIPVDAEAGDAADQGDNQEAPPDETGGADQQGTA
jgi:hypothetical protein